MSVQDSSVVSSKQPAYLFVGERLQDKFDRSHVGSAAVSDTRFLDKCEPLGLLLQKVASC